jgi:hypothetical protein
MVENCSPKVSFPIFIFIVLLLTTVNSLYFDLEKNKETCFHEEFFNDSAAIIQYKPLKSFEKLKKEPVGFFQFTFKSYNESKQPIILYGEEIEGKVIFIIPESDSYEICIKAISNQDIIYESKIRSPMIKFSLTIDTNERAIDFPHDSLPNNIHMVTIDEKLRHLDRSVTNIIKQQDFGLENEDRFTEFQKENNNTLLIITLIQIGLIIGVFLYTCLSLKSQVKYVIG